MAHFENTLGNGNNHHAQINNKKKNIRVFVADDHQSILDAIVNLLAPHCEIVGTATDGKTALEMIERLKPEIAVLDISMPLKTGIDITAELKARRSEVKVVIITTYNDETFRHAAFSAGASAFVTKTNLAHELIPALESAYSGKVFISPNDKLTADSKESRR
jgi:DNA-binding NarL/FixJ family response regulator